MAIYHYKDSPLIDSVRFKSLAGGIVHATIAAKEGAPTAEVQKLREALGAQGLSTLIDEEDGHFALQVRGLRKPEKLIAAISGLGHAQGGVIKKPTPDDVKPQYHFGERVRGKALFLSSIFYHLGNISMVISGIQRGRHNQDGKFTWNDISELMVGVTFGIGDGLMTVYSDHKGDEELSAAAQGLKQHLHRKGIEVPQDNELNPDTLHQSGAFKAANRWLHKHIGHVKCLTETLAGILMIVASLKPRDMGGDHLNDIDPIADDLLEHAESGKHTSSINRGKLAAGFLLTTGWLSTFLLDKPRGQSIFRPQDYVPSTLVDKVKDNPRGWIARPAAIGNNFANLYGALIGKNSERATFSKEVELSRKRVGLKPTDKNKKYLDYTINKEHDYRWNVLAACSFLVANFLFGLSGKKNGPKHTEDDKAIMEDLVLLSANVLAKQPQTASEAVINEAADYVSTLAHVSISRDEVAQAIKEKVAGLSKGGWVNRVQASSPSAPALA